MLNDKLVNLAERDQGDRRDKPKSAEYDNYIRFAT